MKFSLYDLATYARRIIIGFLIFAIVIIAIDTIAKFFQSKLTPFVPNVTLWQELPSNVFGPLTFPTIPTLSISQAAKPNFATRGDFPQFPDTGLVYRIDKPREKLDSIDRAKHVAEALGFAPDGYTTVGNTKFLVWENDRKTRRLEHDIVKRTWSLKTVNYFQDKNALQPKTTDDKTPYDANMTSMMSTLGFTDDTYTNTKADFLLTKRNPERFVPINVRETPEYAVGSVYRRLTFSNTKDNSEIKLNDAPVTDYKAYVYSQNAEQGSAYMVVADHATNPATELYELDYTDFEYTKDNGYYYVISPTLAWNNVQTGQGKLVSLIKQGKSRFDDYAELTVRRFIVDSDKTELAYLEPKDWSGYIYPMYIFRGVAELDTGELANFVFYISALKV